MGDMWGRQAIVTKWLAPTNTLGSRVKATCDAGSTTVGWDHAQGVCDNHAAAAQELVEKLDWPGTYVCGGMPQKGNSFSYVFVCIKGGSFEVKA